MEKRLIFLGLFLLLLIGCAAGAPSLESVPDSVNIASRPTDSAWRDSLQEASESPYVPFDRGEVPGESGEVLPQSGFHYFAFERSGREECDPDGLQLLTENRCIASFRSADPVLSGWVNGILQQGQDRFDSKSSELLHDAREFIRDFGKERFYSYSNYEDWAVARHDDRVASVVTISHVHSGGAHPNSVQTALNLDLTGGKVLRLEDVIEQRQAPELCRRVQNVVEEKFAPLDIHALYEEAPQTIEQSLQYGQMTPYWYFDRDGLVIFYNQYELGPYAAGIIKAELSYEALSGILKEEFLPQLDGQAAGDLTVTEGLMGREAIFLKLGEEPEQILLEPAGLIRAVQLSEVFWVDETPVTQTMMLSVSEMDESQVLVVTGGFSDPNRSFMVEYMDGTGNLQRRFIHRDGLSDQP